VLPGTQARPFSGKSIPLSLVLILRHGSGE
jgi:hypothetical protein